MSASKNNKSPGKRRYTTRQIMELTEKRRKQMDEEARLRKLLAPLAQEEVPTEESPHPSHDPAVESSPKPAAEIPPLVEPGLIPKKITIEEPKIQKKLEHPEPVLAQEHPVILPKEENSAVLEEDGVMLPVNKDPNIKEAVGVDQAETLDQELPVQGFSTDDRLASTLSQPVETVDIPAKTIKNDFAPVASSGFLGISYRVVLQVLEIAFVGLSLCLMVMMLVHLLSAGWVEHAYDQSPFVLILVLSMLWLNRKNLKKRHEWFWGSTVIVAGGIGVFVSAALEGQLYIELAGFVIVCFGLLLWRYQEECACRLFFPLTAFLFIFAPPNSWEQALVNPFNEIVYHLSAWAVNSFHIPVEYTGQQFHVAGSTIFYLGDPTVFRSLYIGILLAILCLSLQNLTTIWSIFLFVSVAVWAVFANIVRIATTGLIMDNYGPEYAVSFFSEYSFYLVLIVMLAGIFLTAGLLPHKEDFD